MENNYTSPLRVDEALLKPMMGKNYDKWNKRKSSGSSIIVNPRKSNASNKKRNDYAKSINRSQMKAVFPIVILSLFLIYISFLDVTDGSPKHYCLRHCHMCKEMYGRHFMVHLCKDDCMESRGSFIPDCLDLNSIHQYLILSD